jgi:hypothetical protein
MMSGSVRAPTSPEEVVRWIERDIEEYLRNGGADWEADHVLLGQRYGLSIEDIRSSWADARQQRREERKAKREALIEKRVKSRSQRTSENKKEEKREGSVGGPADEPVFKSPSTQPSIAASVKARGEEVLRRLAAKEAEAAATQRREGPPKAEVLDEGPQIEVALQALEKADPNADAIAPGREVGAALAIVEAKRPEAISTMNDKHAVISNLGGKCVVMEWVPSAITLGAKELAYQSFTSFRERYANQYVDFSHTQRSPLATYWLTHPHRRQYEGLDRTQWAKRIARRLLKSVAWLGRRAAKGQLAVD